MTALVADNRHENGELAPPTNEMDTIRSNNAYRHDSYELTEPERQRAHHPSGSLEAGRDGGYGKFETAIGYHCEYHFTVPASRSYSQQASMIVTRPALAATDETIKLGEVSVQADTPGFDTYLVQDAYFLEAGETYSFDELFHYVLTDDPNSYDSGLGFITHPPTAYTLGGIAADTGIPGRVDYYYNIFGINNPPNTNYAEYASGTLTVNPDATGAFSLFGYVFTGHATDPDYVPGGPVVSGYHNNLQINFTFTIGDVLFTNDADVVDFGSVVAGSYVDGKQYDALEGADNVILPTNLAAATAAGYSLSKVFTGNSGDDTIVGSTVGDVIQGGADNDKIEGGGGNDTLIGGLGLFETASDGNNKLYGGDGSDRLVGGSGIDLLFGGDKSDTLIGGSSDDDLVANEDTGTNDSLEGGAGKDTFVVNHGDAIKDFEVGDQIVIPAINSPDKVAIYFNGGSTLISVFDTNLSLPSQQITVVNGVQPELINAITVSNSGSFNGVYLTRTASPPENIFEQRTLSPAACQSILTSKLSEVFVPAVIEKLRDEIIEDAVKKYFIANGQSAAVQVLKGLGYFTPIGQAINLSVFALDVGQILGKELAGAYDNDPDARLQDWGKALLSLGGIGPIAYAIGEYFFADYVNKVLDAIANVILSLETAANQYGNGNDNAIGTASADFFYTGDGNDTVLGGAGNDVFVAAHGGGKDLYNGSLGIDEIFFTSATQGLLVNLTQKIAVGQEIDVDKVVGIENVTGGNGADTIIGDVFANALVGLDGADSIVGGGAADTLQGGVGNDTLDGSAGADSLTGGAGDDTYVIDKATDGIFELPDDGVDTIKSAITVSLALPAFDAIENVALVGVGAINATGNAEDNKLEGNKAGNKLDGGEGADTMLGGGGNDVYFVDSKDDTVEETFSGKQGGLDLVVSDHDYTLGQNLENLLLIGDATSTVAGTGNALNNKLTGNAGSNILDGLGGADTMSGGLGDDTYVVDFKSDTTIEGLDTGNDVVHSSISYALASNIETLELLGNANLTGVGNILDNKVAGNVGNNTLDGRAGADTMSGGLGNDTYIVDNSDDFVEENVGGGTDSVLSAVSMVLDEGIETLTLTGSKLLSGTGNDLDNLIIGNKGSNTLDGLTGNDSLVGGAGNDSLIGADGNDTLSGGLGNDSLTGGDGNDVYVIDRASDQVVELGDGADLVISGINFNLSLSSSLANIEDLTLSGKAVVGMGNALSNSITGNNANNILTGFEGNDTLTGGRGNDSLTGGLGSDTFNRTLATDGRDIIGDFAIGTGGDVLDISDVLIGFNGSNPNSYVTLVEKGTNTFVRIDANGATGGVQFTDAFVLIGVNGSTVDDLVADGNLVMA